MTPFVYWGQSKSKQYNAVTCRNVNLNKPSRNKTVRAVPSIGADCGTSPFEEYNLKRLYALITTKIKILLSTISNFGIKFPELYFQPSL